MQDMGDFNIEVLQLALQNKGFNIEMIYLQNPSVNTNTMAHDFSGIVINSGDHWFAIRKVHDMWWNLNSLNKESEMGPGPEMIGEIGLHAFLLTFANIGHTVLLLKGKLPDPDLNR